MLFIIFFKEKPAKPPSKLSLTFTLLAQRGILEDVATLTKNRNFILNMIVFQIMYGTYVALGNTITPLLGPNGYTPSQVSIIGVIFVFSGVVGCYLMGVFIDKTQRHLVGIRFVTIGLACLYMTATLILPPGIFVLTCVFGLLAGMFNVPILPATYSFATKITGSMPPAVVSGLMMSGAQLYCFIASVT